jgi:CHAD domain-containing protein
MHVDEILSDSAQRGTRRWALDLLHTVRTARDRLDDEGDAEALHDFRVALRRLRTWLRAFRPHLRDTMARKVERRLQRIAQATGTSRDLEVHIAWIETARRSVRGGERYGPVWLLDRLRTTRAISDGALRQVIDVEFDRTMHRVEDALMRYEAPVLEPERRFATAAAELLRDHAAGFAGAMEKVTTLGDRVEAHEARIAAKRLRYLLEPFDDDLPSARALVNALKALQDTLGALHDAQIFGSEIATLHDALLADRAADRGQGPERARPMSDGRRDPEAPDPVPGLALLSRRLRRAERSTFKAYTSSWPTGAADSLVLRVAEIADFLDAETASSP